MLLTKEVEIRWNTRSKNMYIEKGYKFTKIGDTFICKIEDLIESSHEKVDVKCDYCDGLLKKEYREVIQGRKYVNKDCCAKCQQQKTKDVNLIKFGVDSKTKTQEVKNKMKATCIEKYGVVHYSKTNEYKEKLKSTMKNLYGVENAMQLQENKEKARNTFLKRYGEELWHNQKIVDKGINTCRERYGTDYTMQSNEVKSKVRNTMYKNCTCPTSKQQRYLHNLFGGEINYPVGCLSLDIALPEEMIMIEYDGNGHELSVRLGNISKKDFDNREIRRYKYLKSLGWKQIRIKSFCDYLPSDEILINEFNKAKEWFQTNAYGHNHYVINIGNKINDENYGRLRKIKEEDLL